MGEVPPAASYLPPECTPLGEIRPVSFAERDFAWQALDASRGVAPQIPLPPRGRNPHPSCILPRARGGLQTESGRAVGVCRRRGGGSFRPPGYFPPVAR